MLVQQKFEHLFSVIAVLLKYFLYVITTWDNTPLYTKFDPGFSKNQFL